MNAGANTSTAEQSAQDTQISMQSEDVHMSSQAANREGQQMQHAQGKEAKGNMGGAAHMPDSSAEKLAQGGLLPDALLQVRRQEQLFHMKGFTTAIRVAST